MPTEETDPARNAAADIVTFAQKRPLWQQDALRRLATKGSLSPQDIAELLDAVKVEGKALPADRNPPLSPLIEAHLTSAAGGQGPTRLKSVGGIENVNQLKTGETLSFAPHGITLVYGDNGSGKSGYSRIFKSASAARSVEDILADVFVPGFDAKPPASATFQVLATQDGTEVEQSIPWRDRENPPEALRQIRVFDRKGAVLYVKEKTEIEFIPFNLDLLDRLGSLCIKLKELLQNELAQFDTERRGLITGLPVGDARTMGESITGTTTPEEIAAHCRWEDGDTTRLLEVQNLLDCADKTIKELRVKKGRIESLRQRLNTISQGLREEMFSGLQDLRKNRVALRDAAEAARKGAFSNDPALLPGVGEAAWKALWEAARRYSVQSAYPAEAFPVVQRPDGTAAKCVLCHQNLEGTAQSRLQSFEKFVSGDIEKQAATADKSFADASSSLNDISTTASPDDLLNISDIEATDAQVAAQIRTFFSEAQERKAAISRTIESGDFTRIPACPSSCQAPLDTHISQLQSKIEEAQQAMAASRRQELESERASLSRRKLLNAHKSSLESIALNRANHAKLDACSSCLSTTGISKAKSDLNEKYITKQFADALQAELDALGSRRIVTLQVGAQKAASFVKPKFTGSTFSELERVLSEGEHRAVALACFLAETRMMGTKHTIVIDDPVSSLDHARRHLVAKRLVEEARHRQVIIFTHDMVFWADVTDAGEDQNILVLLKDVMRDGKVCGVVSDCTQPWENLSVNQRLDYIQTRLLPKLDELFAAQSAEYADCACSVAGKLRDVWERVVEESVFRKTLLRYRKDIVTTRLKDVSVEYEDWQAVEKGMTRTSNWRHDRSRSQGHASPTTKEIRDEIAQIQSLTKTLDARKNKVVKERDARREKELAPPAAAPPPQTI